MLIFLKAKKDFLPIKKKDILILDQEGSNKIIDLILDPKKNNFNIMEDRGERINLYILFLSLKYLIKSKQFAYKHSFIKSSGAKVAITFIDTNHHYCKVFKNISHCKLIFIQNGRGASYRYFNTPENSLVNDYYFVNSNSFIKYSSKFIKSNYIVSGSIIANKLKSARLKKVNKIQWISQFKTSPFIFPNRTYLFKDAVLNPTKFYLNILNKFCQNNNLPLEIIGLTNSYDERNFYKLISPNSIFLPKEDHYLSSYLKLSSSAIITGMDSQLVYESFALGYRTAFLSRNYFVRDSSWSFGWPKNVKYYDFFYTNKPNKEIVLRILHNLLNSSSQKIKYQMSLYNDVMSYDYENSRIKKILNKLN